MSLFDVINATLATKIADALGKYHKGFFTKRVLKTTEEVEANTNPKNLPSALVVGELINDLAQQPDWIMDSTGKITGYKTQAGADTVFPFKGTVLYLGDVSWTHYLGKTNTYDFSQKILDAGLNPSDYTADNIFFRPKSTTYKSYTNSNNTVERQYTYTNGVVTTISGNVGNMWALNVTDLCYLVV